MAIRFGDAFKGFKEGQEFKQNKAKNRLDQATSMAALMESGYDWDGNQLSQRPDFVSTKDLQRKKLELETQKLERQNQAMGQFGSQGSFGGGGSKDAFVMNPDGKWVKNPAYVNPDKPLSGDAANKYSGGTQGLENIQNIQNTLGITRDSSGNYSFPEKDMTSLPLFGKVNKKVLASKVAAYRSPRVFGVPVDFGIGEAVAQKAAGETGKSLELQFDTLAENMLRARTGATAPDPERIRELSRTLARTFDSPNTVMERLNTDKQFLSSVVDAIKPGSVEKFGQPGNVPQPASEVPEFVPPGYEELYAESKAAGLSDEEIADGFRRRTQA